MTAPYEPIRSFCSRVINLCIDVEGSSSLTYLKGLKTIAKNLHEEAKIVQSIYGGHPRHDLPKKSMKSVPEPVKKKAKKK